jgi:hypothetical protein
MNIIRSMLPVRWRPVDFSRCHANSKLTSSNRGADSENRNISLLGSQCLHRIEA